MLNELRVLFKRLFRCYYMLVVDFDVFHVCKKCSCVVFTWCSCVFRVLCVVEMSFMCVLVYMFKGCLCYVHVPFIWHVLFIRCACVVICCSWVVSMSFLHLICVSCVGCIIATCCVYKLSCDVCMCFVCCSYDWRELYNAWCAWAVYMIVMCSVYDFRCFLYAHRIQHMRINWKNTWTTHTTHGKINLNIAR